MAKPIVDGLESTLTGKATVLRLDLNSEIGQQAAARFGVGVVPTLILVDGRGEVVMSQSGFPRPADIQAKVDELWLTSDRR